MNWSWATDAHAWGSVLLALALLLGMPLVLMQPDDPARRRSMDWFVRAGWIACVLGHLAAFAKLMDGLETVRMLGRANRADLAFIALDVAEPAVVGWAVLAWAVLLVVLLGLRDRVDGAPLIGAAILVPILVGVLLATTGSAHDDLVRRHEAIWASRGVISHVSPLPGLLASALAPLCWLLAPAGTALSAAAVRRWSRARREADPPAGDAARAELAHAGLLVLALSVIWIAACARDASAPLIILGSESPSVEELQSDFQVSVWIALAFAVCGLFAVLFGALHLRPRPADAP